MKKLIAMTLGVLFSFSVFASSRDIPSVELASILLTDECGQYIMLFMASGENAQTLNLLEMVERDPSSKERIDEKVHELYEKGQLLKIVKSTGMCI